MRRFLLMAIFLFIAFFCIAQQNIPGKIIGQIPDRHSPNLYQIQVGAFKVNKNAEGVLYHLITEGLNPSTEKYLDFTRVLLKGIPANEMMNYLTIIKQAGFNEVIIREETAVTTIAVTTIAEKWEITTPDSAYSSFEFNHDRNYVVVENNNEKLAHFGEYSIPQKDAIKLENMGTIAIVDNNETSVSFFFSTIDDPDNLVYLTAVKAEAIAESPELDLFCRTWRVVNCSEEGNIGLLFFISNAGTYFFTDPDGTSNSLSRWRWHGDKMEEIDYTHDDWEHYGRAKILGLTENALKVFDPGYSEIFPGYSTAGFNNYWELVPVNY